MGVRTVELPPVMFFLATPFLMPAKVEKGTQALWQQPTVRLHASSTSRASASWDWDSVCQDEYLFTFVPHFLAPLFLAERRSPKAMLQLVVTALVQQDLLLQCKPLVDWLKAAVVHDGTSIVLRVNPDTALLAVDNTLMDHRIMFHERNLPGCCHLHKPLPLEVEVEVMCVYLKS